MAVGFARDFVGQGRDAARVQRRLPAGKARHRKVETPPEKMHRADLAEIAGAERLQHAGHRDACPEEARHGIGIVGSLGAVLGERNCVRDFVRPAVQFRRPAERANEVQRACMEGGDRHRLERKSGRAAVGGLSDHLMVDQVEAELDAARSIRHQPGREAARIGIERRVPRMVHPGRAGQPIFADDLAIEMQRRTGLAPGAVRDVGPFFPVCAFIWLACLRWSLTDRPSPPLRPGHHNRRARIRQRSRPVRAIDCPNGSRPFWSATSCAACSTRGNPDRFHDGRVIFPGPPPTGRRNSARPSDYGR